MLEACRIQQFNYPHYFSSAVYIFFNVLRKLQVDVTGSTKEWKCRNVICVLTRFVSICCSSLPEETRQIIVSREVVETNDCTSLFGWKVAAIDIHNFSFWTRPIINKCTRLTIHGIIHKQRNYDYVPGGDLTMTPSLLTWDAYATNILSAFSYHKWDLVSSFQHFVWSGYKQKNK